LGENPSMETPGNLFCVAAPSGTGKSSLVKALLELDSRLAVSVSHTTRQPRGQEMDGREYHFVDEAAFRAMVSRGEFFEWAEVHGNLYGTSRRAIQERLERGEDILLEIDWQGALQIKRLFPHAVLIFILPPSWDELVQRLNRRGEDTREVIDRRMVNARNEVAQAQQFDYVIVNALFETALFDLKTVVHSQRLKYAAQLRAKSQVFAGLGLGAAEVSAPSQRDVAARR
jgi:guanylate kinase